jgi:peroxiredoxin
LTKIVLSRNFTEYFLDQGIHMKRVVTPILISAKRQGLIPRNINPGLAQQISQFTLLKEGDKLPEFFTEEVTKDQRLTFQRLFFDSKGTREVKTESLTALTQGTVIVLSMPGADTPTCTKLHLRQFINHLPKFKALGVTLAVLTKNDTDVMHTWLMAELRQASWVISDPELFSSPTLVQDHILAMSDIGLDIMANLGLTPLDNLRLGPVYPRGLYLLQDGIIVKQNIEPDAAQCTITSADTALILLQELQIRATRAASPASPLTFAKSTKKLNDKVKFYISLCQNHSIINDPAITDIDLSGQVLTNAEVALLMSHIKSSIVLTSLKSLDASDTIGLTELAIPALPSLEKLSIGSPDLLNYTLEGSLPKLKEFSLDNATRLSNDKINIAELFYKCPQLDNFFHNSVALARDSEDLVGLFINSRNNILRSAI